MLRHVPDCTRPRVTCVVCELVWARRHKHDIILGICKVITDGKPIPSDLMVECEGTERERLIRQLPQVGNCP
jgi:hypothetical protein